MNGVPLLLTFATIFGLLLWVGHLYGRIQDLERVDPGAEIIRIESVLLRAGRLVLEIPATATEPAQSVVIRERLA